MTSFPQLLTRRELGWPRTQLNIEQAIDQKTEDHLAKGYFDFQIVELSGPSFHQVSRSQDFVAVLSTNKTDQKTQRLALWSLDTRKKVWDLEITHISEKANSSILSECGMVLINSSLSKSKVIVLDGKPSGNLPKLNWRLIIPVGKRILGHWTEPRNQNGERRFPEKSDVFFGEWDQTGRFFGRYLLDSDRSRETHWYTCDEKFWVRLSGGKQKTSIIEVINRVIRTMKTFELPLNIYEERFSSAYIVQNRLFYGKHLISWDENNVQNSSKPTIGIYDLIEEKIIEEFPTGRENGAPKQLVANQHYAAWLEHQGSRENDEDSVQYLDISNKTIREAANIPCLIGEQGPQAVLKILGTILSITYAEDETTWRRKVIEMTTGKLKCDVSYTRFSPGNCSVSNRNLVITDFSSTPPRMYIESFLGQGPSNGESPFRKKIFP